MSRGEYHAAAIERFRAKVQHCGMGCWLWLGSTACAGGYPRFCYRGRTVKAHRWYWEVVHGKIPAGLQLDHLCRNKNCVKPAHLIVVTNAQNQRRRRGLPRKRTRA